MKNILPLFLLCFLISCGQSTSLRDETITAAVKQKYAGKHDDYIIKLLNVDETGTLTVADSIRILKETFEQEQKKEIDYSRTVLATMETFSTAISANRYASAEDKRSASASLEKQRLRIDSLVAAQPVIPGAYSTSSPEKVLTRIINCRFSIAEPSTGKELADTYDFYMAEDYKTVFDMKKAR